MDQIDKINIYSCSNGVSVDQINIPIIFKSSIRTDILHFVHQSMSYMSVAVELYLFLSLTKPNFRARCLSHFGPKIFQEFNEISAQNEIGNGAQISVRARDPRSGTTKY